MHWKPVLVVRYRWTKVPKHLHSVKKKKINKLYDMWTDYLHPDWPETSHKKWLDWRASINFCVLFLHLNVEIWPCVFSSSLVHSTKTNKNKTRFVICTKSINLYAKSRSFLRFSIWIHFSKWKQRANELIVGIKYIFAWANYLAECKGRALELWSAKTAKMNPIARVNRC